MEGKYKVGSIVTGKVTGIQAYGAFISLDEKTQGLVHISEITNGYVRRIEDYLSVGDVVKVKVISVDPLSKKISLSLRATKEPYDYPNVNNMVIRVPKPNKEGFNMLRKKLDEWIKQQSN
ncbi:MAG: S1 domain-containing post-transcriptional regulator GSP13 [Bacillaceae bacterium]